MLEFIHCFKLINFIKIIGKIIEISMSKIMNSSAIKKNWIENDFRGDLNCINPHSNGDDLFKFGFDFFEIKLIKSVIKIIIRNRFIDIIINLIIYFLSFWNFLIGS